MSPQLARRYGPWVGLVIAALAYFPRFAKDPTGMTLYPQAADCLLKHLPLAKCALPFTYPPAFAFFMIPFVPLPIWARDLLWYAVTIGATVIAWRCCESLARRLYPGPWSEWGLALWRIASGILSLKFILAVLENQAYDSLALAFILVGLWTIASGRANAGAVSLAVAAAIKATPLIFLPWLIVRRQYAAAACFVAAFLAVSLLPDLFFARAGLTHGYFATWAHDVAGTSLQNNAGASPFAFWSGSNLLNHSLRGMVGRLIDEHAHAAQFKLVLYATWLTFASVLGVLLLKLPRRDENVGIDGSLLLIGMLMLSPMTSRSHYVALMLPYVMLVAAYMRDTTTRRFGLPVLVASFILCTATSNDLVGQRVTEWAYFNNCMPLGAMALMIYLAAVGLRAPVPRPLVRATPAR